MNHKFRTFDCGGKRLFVHKISLKEFKLIEEILTISFTKWCKLFLIIFVANGAADTVSTVLEE